MNSLKLYADRRSLIKHGLRRASQQRFVRQFYLFILKYFDKDLKTRIQQGIKYLQAIPLPVDISTEAQLKSIKLGPFCLKSAKFTFKIELQDINF